MTLEPGHGMPGGHGHMRSSTADRERAIDVLKAAFAEGRLSRDEFEHRSGQVYRSLTYAELAVLTADLPAGPLGAMPHHVAGPQPFPVVVPRRPVNSLAVVALICSLIPGIPAAAAIITGVAARSQIRETGERGDGVATAAIVIGSISLVGFLLFLVSMMGL
jgi:DUF1707 SHOCT-like domain/Domain of unknown function (DUF4190)